MVLPLAALGSLGSSIGELGGGLAVRLGAAGKGGKKSYEKAYQAYNKLQEENFDFTKLEPEEVKIVQQYMPDVWNANLPEGYQPIEVSPEARQAQMGVLQKFQEIGQQGIPLEQRLGAQEAQRALASEAGNQQKAILQNLQERGLGGAGTEIAMRMGGQQQASELARGLGSDLARQSIEEQMSALQSAGNLSGTARSQDINLATNQSQALNEYNWKRAQALTEAEQAATNIRNQAQLGNVQEAQRVAESNVAQRNAAAQDAQARADALKQYLMNYRLSKAGGEAGALGNLGKVQYGEQAAKAQQIMGLGKALGGGGGVLGGILGGSK